MRCGGKVLAAAAMALRAAYRLGDAPVRGPAVIERITG